MNPFANDPVAHVIGMPWLLLSGESVSESIAYLQSATTGWLIGNTIVALMIALVAVLADRIAKRPSLAHLCWVLVLVKLVTPPIVSIPITLDISGVAQWSSGELAGGLGGITDTADQVRMTRLGSSLGQPADSVSLNMNSGVWWLGVWLVGGIVCSVWIVRASRRVHRLIDRRGRFDITATRRLADLAKTHEGDLPSVWLVDAVVSPMLISPLFRMPSFGRAWFGKACLGSDVRTARIVFPKSLWQRLDADAQAALLRHELEHWRRRDFVVRFIEVTTMVVLWWHPLFWVAKRQIEDCEERCCDVAAAGGPGRSPRVYAEAILRTLDFLCEPMERHHCEVETRPVASGVGRLPKIEQRLREIMKPRCDLRLGRGGWLMLAGLMATLPIYPSVGLMRGSDQSSVRASQEGTGDAMANGMLSAKSTLDDETIRRFGSSNSGTQTQTP